MRRLLLVALLLVACQPFGPPPTPSPPAPNPSVCKNLPPVWHPERLKAIQPCVVYRGTVLANLNEQDGDHHLWIAPASGYENLLNGANVYRGQKALVAEIVPACTTKPADEASAAKCPVSTLKEPKTGDVVIVTGPLVEDTKHSNWREVHPVAAILVTLRTP